MQQLRERAGKIVQHLSVDKVSGPDGVDIIRREMEKSPIIKILDNKKVDRRRQKFMKLGRLPSESIESFLNRAEIYRRENDTSPEYQVGSKFYVGHLLDAAKLTKRDLALIKASAGGTLEDEDKVTTALLELAEQLEGAAGCYIGKGETTLDQEDKYLVQKPSSATVTSSSSSASTATGYRRRFRGGFRGNGRKLRDTLMAILEDDVEEDDEDGGILPPEATGEESCEEVDEQGGPQAASEKSEADQADMLAEIYAQEFKARNRVREIKKMRQYYQHSNGGGAPAGRRREQDPHVKKWVEERQKTDPCFLCGKLGHWSEECPLRKKGAAAGGSNQVYNTNVTFAASRDSTPDWEFLERYLAASHEYKGVVLDCGVFDVHTSDVIPLHETMWSMHELGNRMIVDLGCMKTVAGTTWMKTFLARLTDLGRYFQVVREAEKFRFGDGRVLQSRFHVVAEVSLATIHCVLRISVVPGECPPLLSKNVCTLLGFVLDTDQHTVSSKRYMEYLRLGWGTRAMVPVGGTTSCQSTSSSLTCPFSGPSTCRRMLKCNLYQPFSLEFVLMAAASTGGGGTPSYFNVASEKEWEMAGQDDYEDEEIDEQMMLGQLTKKKVRRPSSPIGKFNKQTSPKPRTRVNRLSRAATPDTQEVEPSHEKLAAMAYEMAQKMMQEMKSTEGYGTQRSTERKSSAQGSKDKVEKKAPRENKKAALTGSQADFPTLSNHFSLDITFNIIRSITAQTITFKWKLMLLLMRVKAAVEMDGRGLRWKRNPRWIMQLHGRHLASLWGHVGAARQLCWNPKTFMLADGEMPEPAGRKARQ